MLAVVFRVWLATYDKQANPIDSRDEERVRDFITAKVNTNSVWCGGSETLVLTLCWIPLLQCCGAGPFLNGSGFRYFF